MNEPTPEEQIKETQKLYEQFGMQLSEAEAELISRDETLKSFEQIKAEARPSFIKDGHGIRGPKRSDLTLDIVGADGRDRDMQVARVRTTTSGSGSGNEDNPLVVVACDVAGEPGILNTNGTITLLPPS